METFYTIVPPNKPFWHEIMINGEVLLPKNSYCLGTRYPGDRLTFLTLLDGGVGHKAFTYTDRTGLMAKHYKTDHNEDPYQVVYTKTIRVFGDDVSVIPPYPLNASGLEVGKTTYVSGIFRQERDFFFCVVQDPDDADPSTAGLPIGTVLSINMLEGIAKIHTGDKIAHIHWSKMPYRSTYGFRLLHVGERIEWSPQKLVDRMGTPDIIHCTLANS